MLFDIKGIIKNSRKSSYKPQKKVKSQESMFNTKEIKMQKSNDEFEVLDIHESQRTSKISQMNSIYGEKQAHEVNRVYEYMGKVVCVDYDQNDKPFFKYGTGCLINSKVVLISANTLFSQRTNKIHEHIYFIPNRFLEGTFDFSSQQKIRVSNYYINPKYFNQMNDRNQTHSVYDVAICELDGQDLKRLKFQYNFVDVGLDINYDILNQNSNSLLICKYSQLEQKKRHVLQVKKSQITEKSSQKKLINYKYKTQDEEDGGKHEDAFIFYKVMKDNDWQYFLIGIHKGALRQESYGFLLSEFFASQNLLSYEIEGNKEIDFNHFLKRSFNELLRIMLKNKSLNHQEIGHLNVQVHKLNEKLQANQNQKNELSKIIDHYVCQNQQFSLQIQKSNNGGQMINRNAIQLKNKKIESLKKENQQFKKTQVQLRARIIDLQLFIQQEKVKTERFYELNGNQKQERQKQINRLKKTIDQLNKLNDIQDKKILQLKGTSSQTNEMNKQIQKMKNANTVLEAEKEKLQQQVVENFDTISQMCTQNQMLKESEKRLKMQCERLTTLQQNLKETDERSKLLHQSLLNQLRNPQTIQSAQSLFVPNNVNERQQIIHQGPRTKVTVMVRQQNMGGSIAQSQDIRSTVILDGSLNINRNNMAPESDRKQKSTNIFSIFNGKQQLNSKLQKKVLQIKQIYQQQVKKSHKLKKPLDYLQNIYKDKKYLVTENYFKNQKKIIQKTQQRFPVNLTSKGYSLYLESINCQIEEFFKFDWTNLEFLKLIGCKMNNEIWNNFCQKAQIFLPNLKILRVELSHEIQIKEEQLLNFWSINIIWFQKKKNTPDYSVLSQNQVKRFVQNKRKNHSMKVQVEFV